MNQTSNNNQKGGQKPQQKQSGQNRNSHSRSTDIQARREAEQAAAIKNYTVGQVVEGKIMHFFKAGEDHAHQSALVRIKNGGTALMLYNEIPGYPRNVLSQVYAKDDIVEVEITAIRPSKNRMSVSLVPVLCRKFASSLERGSIVEATIIDRVNYGYFVDLGGGLEALLHKDNLDVDFHDKVEIFEIGEKTEVVVLSVENQGKRIGVGRRQLFE
jgi:ribosomal protein S1